MRDDGGKGGLRKIVRVGLDELLGDGSLAHADI